ncbi:MAG TPA: porin [Afipia sp.]
MKRDVLAASAAGMMLVGSLTGAHAADSDAMVTKAPPAIISPAAPTHCTGFSDFFLTDCQLYGYGVRFYGTIDMGYGYHTHGAPYNPFYGSGTNYQLGRASRQSMWVRSPNALSQSNVGISIKEPLGLGWTFLGQVETAFNPYSMNIANVTHSLLENRGVPLNQQTAASDSALNGTWYGGIGYAGISNDTYGTLTVFRQRSLMADVIRANDSMNTSYAFSPLGYSSLAAGGGSSQVSKPNTAVKYTVNINNFRLGAFALFGGYDLGNGAQEAYEGQVGGDFKIGPGLLTLDVVGGMAKDAVSLSLGGTAITQTPFTATVADTKNVLVAGTYKVNKLKLSAGYEWIDYSPPSNPISINGQGFDTIAGDFVCLGCTNINGTNINNTAYSASNGTKDKVLQYTWLGARYSVTETLDVAIAWYHVDQNNYAASKANLLGCVGNSRSGSFCAGSTDTTSALVDWQFLPKWDTYLGIAYSQGAGGMNSGYLARNDLATTAGVRFRW